MQAEEACADDQAERAADERDRRQVEVRDMAEQAVDLGVRCQGRRQDMASEITSRSLPMRPRLCQVSLTAAPS